MLLDNVLTYSRKLHLSSVNMQFLPKYTTAKLQPFEKGIIKHIKSLYEKHLMTWGNVMLHEVDDTCDLLGPGKLLQVTQFLKLAWDGE